MTHRSARRPIARYAVAALVATGGLAAALPTSTATAADPTPRVTVTPDPSYQQPAFEGWGTSLVWFANATGNYPDEIRNKLADLVFGKDGLNLNIARYNIGGGNAPDVRDYLRPGGAVQGWWQAPAGTTRADVDWWSADDPNDWNPDADRTQRWWVDKIKDSITHWETFSNSPPWFMTQSGYVSGNFDASKDNVKPSSVEDFAKYVAGVTQRLAAAHGIKVATVDPLNEPNTSYWGTRLGTDGNPTGGRQEGAHVSPQMQQQVITAVARQLAAGTTGAKVSAMDETNPGTFVSNWMTYPQSVKSDVAQMNVHTYGTGQRTAVRDLSKAESKPLWMSEVEGNWGDKQDFVSMDPGLGMAQRITDDLRELEPSAWVFWQPVEDYWNMAPGGESAKGMNWGSIQLPFNCTATDTLQSCPIRTNTKFNTVRNFTHYIRPGDHIVKVDDVATTAAINDKQRTVTLVHTNNGTSDQDVVVDLSKFGKIGPKATVTPIVTDVSGALQQGATTRVSGSATTIRVPARSVTTIVVADVRGVAKDAATFSGENLYRFTGVQSGKSLTATADGLVIMPTDTAVPAQLFTVVPVAAANSNRAEYQVRTLDGRQVVNRAGALALESAPLATDDTAAAVPAEARWYVSTTGTGTWTLTSTVGPVNVDVGGQSTRDGAPVGLWQPNAASNQAWRVADETVADIADIAAFTVPGLAPTLPATVTPTRGSGGSSASLPVTWQPVPDARWKKPGTVYVFGTATDPATGTTYRVRAVVTVDTITTTQPAAAVTYPGGIPGLPATVTAVSDARHVSVTLPVTWDTDGVTYDQLGQVTVTGTATRPDGSTLPATVVVTVKPPVITNAALQPGTTATATFTEPGYSPQGVVNGNLTDKAWSTWVSGTQRPGATLTVTLPAARDITSVTTRFYQDGGNVSYAKRLRVEARVAGVWTSVSDWVTLVPTYASGAPAAPVVDVPVTATPGGSVSADAVRVVMEAPNYLTVSEVQVFAKSADTNR